jgi:serine protease Do
MTSLKLRMGRQFVFIPIIVLSLVLGAFLAVSFSNHNTAYAADRQTVSSQQRAVLHDLQDGLTSIVEQVSPSVVRITSEMKPKSPTTRQPGNDLFKNFPFPFSMPEPEGPDEQQVPAQAMGTGVIVTSDGYILTNDHVVGGAESVTVKLKDGREFHGKVVEDPKSDLALVKIDATGLPAAKLGDASRIKVGSLAIAIGNPFGLDESVTFGVVSAIKRSESVENRYYANLIQTDASINPGNSGGPLVSIDGEVIGINTLIRSSMGGGSIGIGFAIPIDTAKFVMSQLMAHGKVTRGYMGIVPSDLSPSDQKNYGVTSGAFVSSVAAGGPADKAGIQPEDVIIEVDGKKVADQLQLRNILESLAPGRTVKVVVVRNKEQKTIDVKVAVYKEQRLANAEPASENKMGFTVDEVTPEQLADAKLPANTKGVIVSEVNPSSQAARNGVSRGDIITRVNDLPVTSVSEFEAATKNLKPSSTVRLWVRSSEGTALLKFTLE